jgi:uncharacterized repeat protein (TIGR03803 family)
LLLGTDGNFYGTTDNGGIYNCGEVFSISAGGTFTVVYSMDCSSGGNPDGEMVQAQDGTFYGTDYGWGKFSWGTVYKLTPQGVFSDLHDFTGNPDGGGPYAGLIQGTDGNFYGAASGGAGSAANGNLYKINSQGALSLLHTFVGTDGANPYGGFFQHTSGTFYGGTVNGGIGTKCTNGCGTFYKLDMGLGPFVVLLPTSGKIGSKVEALGQGFTGTTSVSFNGMAAVFTVHKDTYLTAKVPVGASTGFVTVTTPTGTLTSNKQFVIR